MAHNTPREQIANEHIVCLAHRAGLEFEEADCTERVRDCIKRFLERVVWEAFAYAQHDARRDTVLVRDVDSALSLHTAEGNYSYGLPLTKGAGAFAAFSEKPEQTPGLAAAEPAAATAALTTPDERTGVIDSFVTQGQVDPQEDRDLQCSLAAYTEPMELFDSDDGESVDSGSGNERCQVEEVEEDCAWTCAEEQKDAAATRRALGLDIPFAAFERLARTIAQNHTVDARFEPAAIRTLHTATEAHVQALLRHVKALGRTVTVARLEAARERLDQEAAEAVAMQCEAMLSTCPDSQEWRRELPGHGDTRAKAAGLVLSVSVAERLLRLAAKETGQGRQFRFSKCAPIYLASILEYLAAEILERSGSALREDRDDDFVIKERHVRTALRDPELALSFGPFIERAFAALKAPDGDLMAAGAEGEEGDGDLLLRCVRTVLRQVHYVEDHCQTQVMTEHATNAVAVLVECKGWQIATHAAQVTLFASRNKIDARAVQTAAKLVLTRSELPIAVSQGTKAVVKYTNFRPWA